MTLYEDVLSIIINVLLFVQSVASKLDEIITRLTILVIFSIVSM